MDKTLRQRILTIAKRKGMHMKDIARELGITPVSLSQSLSANPSYKRLRRISEILGVNVADLVENESATSNPSQFRIKEICRERGLEMQDLASMVGIDPASLSRAINGNPQFSTLNKIATALNVDVRDLIATTSQVKGYLEINNRVLKISSVEDLKNAWEMVNS